MKKKMPEAYNLLGVTKPVRCSTPLLHNLKNMNQVKYHLTHYSNFNNYFAQI